MEPVRVLVVDDESSLRALCVRCLRQAGFAAEAVSGSTEAIARLGEGWDIVLSDIFLSDNPEGLALLRQAKTSCSADVIVMTGSPDMDSVLEALRGGAYDYIIKPFRLETLVAVVRRCADKRVLSQELSRERETRAAVERAHQELLRMNQILEVFGRFATPEVVRHVLADPAGFWKRGERKTVTVLFADARRFTEFAARVSPEEALEALQAAFAPVLSAIQEEGGILNKFMGDGLLAIFGAPLPNERHASGAARAALRARDASDAVAKEREERGLKFLRLGIGINTGEAVVGCIGTRERAEYGVLGHAVNLASRLEEAASAGQILVGPETARLLEGRFELRERSGITLPGVFETLRLWELGSER